MSFLFSFGSLQISKATNRNESIFFTCLFDWNQLKFLEKRSKENRCRIVQQHFRFRSEPLIHANPFENEPILYRFHEMFVGMGWVWRGVCVCACVCIFRILVLMWKNQCNFVVTDQNVNWSGKLIIAQLKMIRW